MENFRHRGESTTFTSTSHYQIVLNFAHDTTRNFDDQFLNQYLIQKYQTIRLKSSDQGHSFKPSKSVARVKYGLVLRSRE